LLEQGGDVGGDLYLNEGFLSSGAVWLGGATITGQMVCTGARLGAVASNLAGDIGADEGSNKNGNGLGARGLHVL
jgi:hypothetical protein